MSDRLDRGIDIADAGTADIEEVRALFLEYARSLGFSLCFQGFDKELAELPGAYAPPRGVLLLARRGQAAVGCVGLRPLAQGRGEMKRLYVQPECRGLGLGRRLARVIVERARGLGYARVCLDTLEDMGAARAIYAEMGFEEIPAYYDNPLPGVRYCELALGPRG